MTELVGVRVARIWPDGLTISFSNNIPLREGLLLPQDKILKVPASGVVGLSEAGPIRSCRMRQETGGWL